MGSFFFTQDESASVDTHAAEGTEVVTGTSHRRRNAVRAVRHSQVGDFSGVPSRRPEIVPPSLFSRNRPVWKTWATGFWHWLWDTEEKPQAVEATPGLGRIKSKFITAMWDVQSLHANEVRLQVEAARSLRELWHLRAQVFKTISTHQGQIEAQLRLDSLDTHFPVKSSRRDA